MTTAFVLGGGGVLGAVEVGRRTAYYGPDDERLVAKIDRATFETKWTEEVAELAGQTEVETIRLATGLLLPIWSALPSDHLAVNRIVDGQGNSWLGRLVFDQHVVQPSK